MLIDYANNYITNHKLRFNPTKTDCIIFGKRVLTPTPTWVLNGCPLKISDSITYLGVELASNLKSDSHVENRIRKCQRAFYSLQGVGLCKNGTSTDVKSYVWNTNLSPILSYGCQCVNISKTSRNKLDKFQSKLLKSCLGLPKYCRSSDLLIALGVPKIAFLIMATEFDLIFQIFNNSSVSRQFYTHLINCEARSNMSYKNTLIDRIKISCAAKSFSFCHSILNKTYSNFCKNECKRAADSPSGIADSVQGILFNDPFLSAHSIITIKNLLSPF